MVYCGREYIGRLIIFITRGEMSSLAGATTDIINTTRAHTTPTLSLWQTSSDHLLFNFIIKALNIFLFINCVPLSDHYCNGRLRAGEEMDTFNLMEWRSLIYAEEILDQSFPVYV